MPCLYRHGVITRRAVSILALMALLAPAVRCDDDNSGGGFDPLQAYPNMPADYAPETFASDESNHLQYFQDADVNEWKWETTQNLQRDYLTMLFNISSKLHAHPDMSGTYEELREHLDAHCNRVYNGEDRSLLPLFPFLCRLCQFYGTSVCTHNFFT